MVRAGRGLVILLHKLLTDRKSAYIPQGKIKIHLLKRGRLSIKEILKADRGMIRFDLQK